MGLGFAHSHHPDQACSRRRGGQYVQRQFKFGLSVYGIRRPPAAESMQLYFGGEKYQGIVLTRTESQLKADLSKLVDPSYAAGIAPQNWIEITGRNEKTGYVTGIKIWGQEVSISKFYEEVTGAYSPAFEFSYANGVFTFTAWGNGHGVGMSQYGAMGMIGKGMMDWTQVLAHYYPGTTLQRI